MRLIILSLAALLHLIENQAEDRPCLPKDFGGGSVACYCDESYCDSVNANLPSGDQFLHVESNKDGLRFSYYYGELEKSPSIVASQCLNIIYNRSAILTLHRSKREQSIHGFGSTFTDSTGYNLNRLSSKLQDDVIDACYGSEGLKLNLARTSIGHTDFSSSPYYYNDSPYDVKQVNWSLTEADYNYRIPYIKKARAKCPDQFRLISSLWTVPEWMRVNSDFGSRNQIISSYYDSYALYIIKYLEAFRKEGIENWGVTYVNEPIVNLGVDIWDGTESLFSAWTLNRLINFGTDIFIPALRDNGFGDVKTIFLDDNRHILYPSYVKWMAQKSKAPQVMEYAALHSYLNHHITSEVVDVFHTTFPNTTIITTEYCRGLDSGVLLGSWKAAEFYAPRMIEEMNHHTSGWIDWNMVLNTEGGPHYKGVSVDAMIIVDTDSKGFFKQPAYYVMGHFSKFITRGSIKIGLDSVFSTGLHYAAVERLDGYVVVILFNESNSTISITINDSTKGDIRITVTPNSINTIIF